MIKLIIFDWDDVLTQGSIAGYYQCYHEAMLGVGVHLAPELEEERIKAKWGAGHQEQLAYILQEHPELVPKAVELYDQHLFGDTFVDCITMVAGVQSLLTNLARNYKLALATGAHPKILDRLMSKFTIPAVFAQVVSIYDLDDPAHAKPHPHILNKIMTAEGVTPAETIMVGDAESDVLMARNAAVEPVVVLTGHLNRQQAEQLKVQYIINQVTQLPAVLQELNSL